MTGTCAALRPLIYVFSACFVLSKDRAMETKFKAAVGAAIALTTFSAGGQPTAAQQCRGPFASCANEVSATCPLDPRGEPRITFVDRSGNAMRFEKCVGRIFAAVGQPDPYKTGQMPTGNLQMPAVEILEPSTGHRD